MKKNELGNKKFGRKFKNLKIGKRLFLCFSIIIIMFIVSSIISIVNLKFISNQVKKFDTECYDIEVLSWEGRSGLNLAEKAVYKSTSTTNRKMVKEYTEDITSGINILKYSVAELKKNPVIDVTIISKIENEIDVAVPISTEIIKLLEVSKNSQSIQMMEEQFLPRLNTIQSTLDQIDNGLQTKSDNFMNEISKTSMISIIALLISGIFGTAVAVLLGLNVTKSIVVPAKEIFEAANAISNGNFDYKIQYSSDDELGVAAKEMINTVNILQLYIGKISEVLNKMAVGDMTASIDIEYVGGFAPIKKSVEKILFSLNNTLSQINESSEQVASGSEQVSGGAQALSQGATEQASSIEELSASINEISEQVKQNAKKSNDVSKITNSTAREVEAGSEQMELMTKAMLDIKQSSNEIAKIIKAINDIAFQTNILALNAAVEAARAGSAGKGFAVVADEVRNLASKSAESAKNTTVLIENSIKAVEKGTKIADKTAGLMVSIVSDINKSVLLIDQITEASNEQAVSIMQVTQGIEQISSVVQTNSATSEESAAASEELSGQANRLKNLVSKFKLRNASVNKDTKNDANTELAL